MSESLTGRVGRIISGSVNALVDAIENAAPGAVMEEAIREVDSAIDEVRTELGKVIAGKHLANTRLMSENTKHEELAAKIQLAISEGRDDLAEAAIAHQLDIEAKIPVLEATISDCSSQEKELEGYVNALQAKKREMQEELKQFIANKKAESISAEAIANGTSGSNINAKVEKAESAFQRVAEKATGVPSSSGASDAKTAAQLAELDELARKNRIQERLSAIKNNKA
jgi:phage shock protein A